MMVEQAPPNDIATWNETGRAYMSAINLLIKDMREGRDTPEDWPGEPRGEDIASRIIAAAEAVERQGHWNEDAPVADRAHEPFVSLFDGRCQNLRCVTILGVDEFLICQGSTWKPGDALHLKAGAVTVRPDILGAAMTRSHDLLVIANANGFVVAGQLDGDALYTFGWPEGVKPTALDLLSLSETGQELLFSVEEEQVWLGQWNDGAPIWTCVYPNAAFLAEIADDLDEDDDEDDDEDEESAWSDSMMHCAISPDGRYIAYGSQCYGHFIDRIEAPGKVRRWAEIGRRSEYPHNACFSNDSAYVALNSCHFYHGATLGVKLDAVEGAVTPDYDDTPLATEIDDGLRVYASTWLPQGAGRSDSGFALAGASDLVVATPDGRLLMTLYFGSSASSVDYCPKTGQLAIASYSGFLHIYDPARAAEDGKTIGYHPVHERYRWVIWQDRAPFRW